MSSDQSIRLRSATLTPEPVSRLAGKLKHGIEASGLELPGDGRQRLLDFLALLSKWNGVYNLTAVRDVADMLVVHLLDALSIVELLETYDPTSILDVGSGAGLPGIPLAIARPRWQIRSVDAVAKKIGFQRQVKAELALSNFTPVHARVETLSVPVAPTLIVSRAYADMATMLTSVDALAGPETTIVAMKGAVPTTELDALPIGWTIVRVASLDVPFLGARRCAVVLRRAA